MSVGRLLLAGAVAALMVGCASSPEKKAAHEAKLASLEQGFVVNVELTPDDAFAATVQAFNNLNYGIKMASRQTRKLQTGERLLNVKVKRSALGNTATAQERTLRFYTWVEAGDAPATTSVVFKPEVFVNGVAEAQLWSYRAAIASHVAQLESELKRVVEFGQLAPELERKSTPPDAQSL
jgi:hypothetical protein